MKTSLNEFLEAKNKRHIAFRKLISILCVLSILVSIGVSAWLTQPGLTASVDPALANRGIFNLVTDPESHNGWINYFQIGQNSYNTEFVGSIWTDKSVFQTYTTSKGQEISAEQNNMLGVLSAIGSSMAITGRIYTPTDVMLILDMSSSMYVNGTTRNPTTVRLMVQAVNKSIATLLSLNQYNRVGVTVYYGKWDAYSQSESTYGYVLLPLDRYTPADDGSYITAHESSGKLSALRVTNGIKNSNGASLNPANYGHDVLAQAAGTYTQLGILHAMDQFLAADDLEPMIESMNVTVKRQPIFVLMSDGEPTAAAANFTHKVNGQYSKVNANFGSNRVADRAPNESDFATQLTAAYAKAEVETYYPVEPLFYTLGLKMTTATHHVLDPANSTTSTINQYWNTLVNNNSVYITADNFGQPDWSGNIVKTTLRTGESFPSSTDQRLYVDRFFEANSDNALEGAFESIVDEIILRSIYTPTATGENRENTSGEVSFIDQIGQYMEVKGIKGILIGGILHTGEAFSEVLANPAETLGTLQNATEFGMAFWNNVMEQIGIDDAYPGLGPNGQEFGPGVPRIDETVNLITRAWETGQLSYDSTTKAFSNYIGWYGGHSENSTEDIYLGFWNDRDPNDPIPEGAYCRIKTYFFRGRVDSSQHQTYETDMMYITVWVKEDIATGEQTVVFSVPASLLPTLKYFVKLDVDGNFIEFYLGSIHGDTVFNEDGSIKVRPVRLVYEVGLQDDITPDEISNKISDEYLSITDYTDSNGNTIERNFNPETGEIRFYANEWERDGSTGYYAKNTYSYFRPSRFNDRYFYVEDSAVYYKIGEGNAETDYVPFDPAVHCPDNKYLDDVLDPEYPLHPEMPLYTIHPKYIRTGDTIIKSVYFMPIGDQVISDRNPRNDGAGWYVPAGVAHTLDVSGVNRFGRPKLDKNGNEVNPTGTLKWRNVPALDGTASLVLASTLGNNGRISIMPEGQTLVKKLVGSDGSTPVIAEEDTKFTFLIYEGGPVTDYSQITGTASVIEVTVPAGKSQSDPVQLRNLPQYTWTEGQWAPKRADEYPAWNCIFQKEYTIVELSSTDKFGLLSLGPDGLTGYGANPYTFRYGEYPLNDKNESIKVVSAVNEFAPWKLRVTKYNDQQQATRLPGAVFGLYSPEEADKITPAGEYAEFPVTQTHDGSTWHLTKIDTTDADGSIFWEGLTRNDYLLVELKAPDGYQQPLNAAQLVSRTQAREVYYLDLQKQANTTYGLYSQTRPEGEDSSSIVYDGKTWYLVGSPVADENGQLYLTTATQDPHLLVAGSTSEILEPAYMQLCEVDIFNTPGIELPATGGLGDIPYMIIGSGMMIAAAALMFICRSKRKEEHA